MRRPLVLATVGILSFLSGLLVADALHSWCDQREVAQRNLVNALGRISAAQVTISLVKQNRLESLTSHNYRLLREGVASAHAAVASGASLRDESIPSLVESFRRATVLLRENGAPPSVLSQAEAVLAQLPHTNTSAR